MLLLGKDPGHFHSHFIHPSWSRGQVDSGRQGSVPLPQGSTREDVGHTEKCADGVGAGVTEVETAAASATLPPRKTRGLSAAESSSPTCWLPPPGLHTHFSLVSVRPPFKCPACLSTSPRGPLLPCEAPGRPLSRASSPLRALTATCTCGFAGALDCFLHDGCHTTPSRDTHALWFSDTQSCLRTPAAKCTPSQHKARGVDARICLHPARCPSLRPGV